jgi:hypothetical protein
MYTCFFTYNDYFANEKTGFGQLGHLLAFNPGAKNAEMSVTVYFEDREPLAFKLPAPGFASTESNWKGWGSIPLNTKFAFRVECELPLALQATIGQNNTGNDYGTKAKGYPEKVRETVLSYMPGAAAREHYLPDGIVIAAPDTIWVLEHEWLILCNPEKEPAGVTVEAMFKAGDSLKFTETVAPQRVKYIFMDEKVPSLRHYGAKVTSDRPVSAQWLRTVNWYDRDEMMSSWSVPLVPGPLK